MTSAETWQTVREIHSIEKEKNTNKSRETITMEAINTLSIKCKEK